MSRNYAFFSHRDCEFFPCHEGIDPEQFNCLFCYCPFYLLGPDCGGDYTYTQNGRKDCTHCTYPHRRDSYEEIIRRYGEITAAMPHTSKRSGSE